MLYRAYEIKVHSQATLEAVDKEDRIDLILTNKLNGAQTEQTYYKLDSGISIGEACKIDIIVQLMHSKVGLDIWEDQ